MKRTTIIISLLLLAFSLQAQVYQFTTVVENKATPVKDQAKTGTCWCFATISFLESELIRMGKGEFDLSEMFVVRNNYYERLNDNYLRRGKGNLYPGSISHMATNVIAKYGIVPEEAYHGIGYDSPSHNHGEMSKFLNSIAAASVEMKQRSPEYYELIEALFDIYLGEMPTKFTYKGVEYTPESFRDYLGLDMNDYVEITSYSHHPFYQLVEVEIPDNWDHGKWYNLPLDEFMAVIDNAVEKGFPVAWDGDCSEQGYVFSKQLCVYPQDKKLTRKAIMEATEIIPEIEVTQEIRQECFETFETEDDHLEHITGIAKDQNGTKYYNTKNSWGTESNGTGYHYMSENFVKAKTIGITVHKDAIPKDIRKKLGIK